MPLKFRDRQSQRERLWWFSKKVKRPKSSQHQANQNIFCVGKRSRWKETNVMFNCLLECDLWLEWCGVEEKKERLCNVKRWDTYYYCWTERHQKRQYVHTDFTQYNAFQIDVCVMCVLFVAIPSSSSRTLQCFFHSSFFFSLFELLSWVEWTISLSSKNAMMVVWSVCNSQFRNFNIVARQSAQPSRWILLSVSFSFFQRKKKSQKKYWL